MVFFPPRWGPHANRRKREYEILNKQIAYTWLFGELHPSYDGYYRLIGEEVTLVLDPEQVFIVTLYPTKYRDRFIARNARFRRADGNVREEWLNGTYNVNHLRNAHGGICDYVLGELAETVVSAEDSRGHKSNSNETSA